MIWVPGHVTALFAPAISDKPDYSGSLGAGFSVGVGSFTELIPSDRLEVYVNGIRSDEFVSATALRLLSDKPFKVYHYTEAPLGFGFGMSASCALGAVLEAARILGIDSIKAAHYAHVAEVLHKTGLGDVIAEFYGGFEIRVKPGSPKTGELIRIEPGRWHVALIVLGELETPKILSDKRLMERVASVGKKLLEDLEKDPESIVMAGREFAEATGLIDKAGIRRLYESISKEYELTSMIMLSRGVFVLSKDPGELVRLKEKYQEHVRIADISEGRTYI